MLVGCLTSQQQASVSQGRICSDNFTCCHTEIEVADQTFYLTQSQYTDTWPTSPSADPITPGAWQGSHWSANFEVTGMTRPRKNPDASGIRTRDLEADALATRPTKRSNSRRSSSSCSSSSNNNSGGGGSSSSNSSSSSSSRRRRRSSRRSSSSSSSNNDNNNFISHNSARNGRSRESESARKSLLAWF